MPWRAMSIMPLLSTQPMSTPTEAISTSVRKVAARDPMAEFRKFTASLLTPTQRSKAARRNRKSTMHTYICSIKREYEG